MPPQVSKRKGKRPIQDTEEDLSHIFINFQARAEYDNIKESNILPEQALELPEHPGDIGSSSSAYIAKMHWERVVQPPKHTGSISLTKEFFANLKFSRDDLVYVRGKWVNVSASAINAYYHIPDMEEEDEYTNMLSLPIDYEDIARILTDNACYVTPGLAKIDRRYLNPEGWLWFMFSCSNLMPKTVNSECNKDRYLLLYAILRGKMVNLGAFLNAELHSKAKVHYKKKALILPSLIYGLCKKAGVRVDMGYTNVIPAMKPINSARQQPRGEDQLGFNSSMTLSKQWTSLDWQDAYLSEPVARVRLCAETSFMWSLFHRNFL